MLIVFSLCTIALMMAGEANADCWIKVTVKDTLCYSPWWDTWLVGVVACNDQYENEYGRTSAQSGVVYVPTDTCWQNNEGLKIWAFAPICSPAVLTDYKYVTETQMEQCDGDTIEVFPCMTTYDSSCAK